MNHGEWMVVVIIGMVLAARVYRDRCGIVSSKRRDRFDAMSPRPAADEAGAGGEAHRLRDEVRSLKARIAVLERIATDHGSSLDREIESLRDRP